MKITRVVIETSQLTAVKLKDTPFSEYSSFYQLKVVDYESRHAIGVFLPTSVLSSACQMRI